MYLNLWINKILYSVFCIYRNQNKNLAMPAEKWFSCEHFSVNLPIVPHSIAALNLLYIEDLIKELPLTFYSFTVLLQSKNKVKIKMN